MRFYTYEIQSPVLKPYIQFLLFNYCNDPSSNNTITYYPNNDVCLGIIHQKELVSCNNTFTLQDSDIPVNSYLTGIYTKPHTLTVNGTFDEICLPFTPVGYYHFFRLPLKQYILGEDVLTEAFGTSSAFFFEKLFGEDITKRGNLIELFLLSKLESFQDNFLKLSLQYLADALDDTSLAAINTKLNCSERKLQRVFSQKLDITPKEYIQVMKFRRALRYMGMNPSNTLTGICYEVDYYDQSHFIRNIKRYTGKKPGDLIRQIKSIDQKVLVSLT
jgi:AraC-like DNA-binding protein